MSDFEKLVDDLIRENPDKWRFIIAHPRQITWFVGQAMKRTNGAGDPHAFRELFEARVFS